MNTQAQAVVLLLLGGAVIRATLTDMHLRYVKEALGPFLIASGVLLVAVGVMTLLHDLRSRSAAQGAALVTGPGAGDGAGDPCDSGDDHGHGHGEHGGPRVGWLLILPVLGLLLFAPPALGSYAAGQAGTALSSQRVSDFAPLPATAPGEPVKLGVLDYASRAVFDKGVSLQGRTVELTGFVAAGPDGAPYLARIVLSCCAADGRPIKVGMAGDAPAGLAPDSWIRVTGRYTDRTAKDPVNGEIIPYLEVTGWQQIEPPRQQYE